MECRLCGRVFTHGGRRNICPLCIRRLEEIYGRVHEYMRDNEDENFDVISLADELNENANDIQALVDLGYIERDLSLYGTRETRRKKLAQAFTEEMHKMEREKNMFYGGEVYARNRDFSGEDAVKTVRKLRQR